MCVCVCVCVSVCVGVPFYQRLTPIRWPLLITSACNCLDCYVEHVSLHLYHQKRCLTLFAFLSSRRWDF